MSLLRYGKKKTTYVVEGPRIERMLGYTNLESEKALYSSKIYER